MRRPTNLHLADSQIAYQRFYYAFIAHACNIENDPVWIKREKIGHWWCVSRSKFDWRYHWYEQCESIAISITFGLNYCDFSRLFTFFFYIFVLHCAASKNEYLLIGVPFGITSVRSNKLNCILLKRNVINSERACVYRVYGQRKSGYLFNIPIAFGIINCERRLKGSDKLIAFAVAAQTHTHTIPTWISNSKIFSLLFPSLHLTSAYGE